jgi:drug/metabolite transporter (DMT)-like permease
MSVSTIESSPEARYRLGLLLVTLSAVAWSTAGYFTRLIPLDAWTTLFWRGVFGTLTALVFILIRNRGRLGGAFSGIGWTGLLFSFASTAGMAAFLAALKATTVAHVAIIYATAPFVTAGLAWAVLRERVSAATLIASLLALAGIVLTVARGLGEGSLYGDGLAFVMTVLMAVIIVIARRAETRVPMVPAACLSSCLSSLVSLPFASLSAAGPVELLQLALFGITNMGLGLILFTIGARLLPAAETALIGALEAPLAPLWVWWAFGETMRPSTLFGGGLVLAAVLGHVLYENRKRAGVRAS